MEVTLTLTQASALAELLTKSGALGYHINDMLRYAEDEVVNFTVLPSETDTFDMARKYLEI